MTDPVTPEEALRRAAAMSVIDCTAQADRALILEQATEGLLSLAAQLEEVTRSRSEIIRNARTLRDDRDSLAAQVEELTEKLESKEKALRRARKKLDDDWRHR